MTPATEARAGPQQLFLFFMASLIQKCGSVSSLKALPWPVTGCRETMINQLIHWKVVLTDVYHKKEIVTVFLKLICCYWRLLVALLGRCYPD